LFDLEAECDRSSGDIRRGVYCKNYVILREAAISVISEKQNKLTAFKKLTNEVTELIKTDPLPPEFDEILSQRPHLSV
jgi:hypothetical protein